MLNVLYFLLLSCILSQRLMASSSGSEKFGLPKRYQEATESVWVEYVALALKYKPLNLGQGFPDYPPPSYVTKALSDVANGDHLLNQYTRGFGHPRLVQALSKAYSQWIGRQIDPNNEILVTVGAYQSLYNAIYGHIDHGDEAIIIEPFYDCYYDMIKSAGGVVRAIPLKPTKSGIISSADWKLDPIEFEKLFNNKTKMLILNTPHNPLGKVFNLDELTMIADLCKKWNVLVIADEVYEHMVFEPNQHIRICTLPDMWERTLTIGSAGKTFSATGWKLGWTYGPNNLIRNMQLVHQNSVYTCATPLQEAAAIGFEYELSRFNESDSFFKSLAVELKDKRDFMATFLTQTGYQPVIPEAGYFMIADWSHLKDKVDLSSETDEYKDYRFTKYMTKNVSLQGIPPSAFYTKANKHLGENFVRYCYIKKDETLQKAADILKKWYNN